jgi:hypothetical protein
MKAMLEKTLISEMGICYQAEDRGALISGGDAEMETGKMQIGNAIFSVCIPTASSFRNKARFGHHNRQTPTVSASEDSELAML